jgi:hypothetical protein
VGHDGRMAGPDRRLRPVLGLVVALLISIGWVATPAPADAALPTWNGGINLYRTGVFSTQKTWLWCTAADVQIMRNIKYDRTDHSRTTQSRYFSYMRGHNRYRLPVSAGVDPKGWEMGLRRYVDPRYRVQAHATFAKALKLAAARMRRTNLPVAVAVSRGNHGWVLHGFTATADPAKTSTFTVTSVRVSGPLWGLQNRTFGYDMRPNTKLSVTQFKRFFTKWWYAPKRMIWDNTFVSIQPLTTSTSASAWTESAGAAPAAVPVEPVSPAPSSASTPAAPSFAPASGADTEQAAGGAAASAPSSSSSASTVRPPDTAPRMPIAALVAGLAAGFGVLLAVLVSRAGRRARARPRIRDPRAGWSS